MTRTTRIWLGVAATLLIAGLLMVVVLAAGLVLGGRVTAWGPRSRAPWGHMMPGGWRGWWRSDGEPVESFDDAEVAAEEYLDHLGYRDLRVGEMMEFEDHYYVVVLEPDADMGAMELLVDKRSGQVEPEPGPNMMWNNRYGMHGGRGGMMRRRWRTPRADESLSEVEARDATQRWLDRYQPGRTATDAHPFPGYYTLHIERDGRIEGMLSVHGETGDVWYHDWHGEFIGAREGEH